MVAHTFNLDAKEAETGQFEASLVNTASSRQPGFSRETLSQVKKDSLKFLNTGIHFIQCYEIFSEATCPSSQTTQNEVL